MRLILIATCPLVLTSLSAVAPLAGCSSKPLQIKTTDTCSTLCGAGNQSACTPKTNGSGHYYYLCPTSHTDDTKRVALTSALEAVGKIDSAQNASANQYFMLPSAQSVTTIANALGQLKSDFGINTSNACQPAELGSFVQTLSKLDQAANTNTKVDSQQFACVQETKKIMASVTICLCSSQTDWADAAQARQLTKFTVCTHKALKALHD